MNVFAPTRRFLDNTKLKHKLLLSYVLFLVLPLITYTYLSYTKTSETLRHQTIVSAEQVFGETVSGLNNRTQNMVNSLNLFTMNQTINRILAKTAYPTWASQLSDYHTITDFLENLENTQPGTRVRIYFRDQFEGTADNVHIFTFHEIRNAQWYTQLNRSHTSEIWFLNRDEGTDYLSVGRIIWNLSNLVEIVGAVKVDIPIASIHDQLSKALVDRSGQIYLVNEKQEIMAGSGSHLLNRGQLSGLLSSHGSDVAEGRWHSATYNGQEFMMHNQPIAATDMKLISLIPMNRVLSNITQLRNQMLAILSLISVLGYFVAMYVAKLSTNRIVKLIRNMRKIQQGEFTTYMNPQGRDEIGELIHNFNYMTDRIKQLVEEQFESGKALKNAELRTLQSQINPHFLYNSLDVINIMAIERQSPDISNMVRSLTTFYKLGLNSGKDLVTIREEIEHIKAYVQIQNIRYEDVIRLVIDIPEPLMDSTILKLTLQPLVENAILHGILEKEEKTGIIRISGEKTADSIVLTIWDDGVGMPHEALSGHPYATEPDSMHGFGIQNVHERIRLSFGEAYGLRFSSERNIGTSAIITIPYMPE